MGLDRRPLTRAQGRGTNARATHRDLYLSESEPAAPADTLSTPPSRAASQPPSAATSLVLGGQACLWTEYVRGASEGQYMALPRLAALSRALWYPPDRCGAEELQRDLERLQAQWRMRGLVHRVASRQQGHRRCFSAPPLEFDPMTA